MFLAIIIEVLELKMRYTETVSTSYMMRYQIGFIFFYLIKSSGESFPMDYLD